MDIRYGAKINLKDKQMDTRDYFGWTVLTDDNRYGPALKNNIDHTNSCRDDMPDIMPFVKNKRCVLEIGVHYGFCTKHLTKVFENVHTFDFDNDVHSCFKINMEKFNVKNLIIHPYGLGDRDAEVSTNDMHPEKGRGPLANHVDISGKGPIFKIKALDSLNIKDVDLMMIDTEGYEYYVLKGARRTIETYFPPLVIEFHKKKISRKFFGIEHSQTEQLLKDMGYRYIKNINKNDRLYIAN